MELNYTNLKHRQRQERDQYPIDLGLRVHRALSWLNRSEQCDADLDAEFIFLWIAFNAAYASDLSLMRDFSEKMVFARFLKKLCDLDSDQRLSKIIWSTYPGSIRVLLDNPYVAQEFWDYHNAKITKEEFEARFQQSKASVARALGKKRTGRVLGIIFNRLYVLRNQLIHGGSTWNSKVNRDQIRDSVAILSKLVPAIIAIMMDHPETFWGSPSYPVIEN